MVLLRSTSPLGDRPVVEVLRRCRAGLSGGRLGVREQFLMVVLLIVYFLLDAGQLILPIVWLLRYLVPLGALKCRDVLILAEAAGRHGALVQSMMRRVAEILNLHFVFPLRSVCVPWFRV